VRRRWWRLAAPGVFAAAGVLFATSGLTARGTDLRAGDRDLVGLIQSQQHRADATGVEAARLRREVDAETARVGSGDAGVLAARRAAAALTMPAGLEAVRGPGLTVTLNDAPKPPAGQPLPQGLTLDDYVVHQQDVQAVVNALWSGGAEAMQLMDQRVISTSAVRCVGNTLLLQGRVYSPPYRITVIGSPARLRAALDSSTLVSTYREYVAAINLGYQVTNHASVTLPAFEGPLALRDATVPRS
jgi:uncharacterized protein YlxW (UPF0749 family)